MVNFELHPVEGMTGYFVYVIPNFKPRTDSTITYKIKIEVGHQSDCTCYQARYSNLSEGTEFKETWNQIKEWFEGCKKNRFPCNELARKNWMPTRLLDVSLQGTLEPYLLIANSDTDMASYLT